MDLKILEKYNFVNQPTLEAVEKFKIWVLENNPDSSNDLPHPQLLDNYLEFIYKSINLFGQELGYDFIKRFPRKEQIHLLSTEKYSELLKKYNDDPNYSKVLSVSHFKDIFVKWIEKRTIFSTLSGIQHDLIHQISSKNVYINPKTENFIVSFGYCIPHQTDRKLLTEALTEMANQYIIHKYWKKYPTLKTIIIEDYEIAYKETVKEIEMKIQGASNGVGESCDELFIDLTRGLIEGDISKLSVLENAS